MAQSNRQKALAKARRAAQQKLAAKLKRGESALGGEFRAYTQKALNRPVTPPPPMRPTPPPVVDELLREESYTDVMADLFSRGTGQGEGRDQQIPLTYRPTSTSYPSRLPQNKHRRTTAAGYNRATQTLAVQFYTDGAIYHYEEVPEWMAREFYLAYSPGDYINDELNAHPYYRVD